MKTKNLTMASLIATLYVVLTLLSRVFGLDSGAIQMRFSEALCILPVFTASAVPGLFIGCLLSNILLGNLFWDVVFGSIATLLGAIGTRMLRKKPCLAVLPPIISNTLIIPFVLAYVYNLKEGIPYFMLTVGIGEILSCGVLGMILYSALKRVKIFK